MKFAKSHYSLLQTSVMKSKYQDIHTCRQGIGITFLLKILIILIVTMCKRKIQRGTVMITDHMVRVMRNPNFCLGENKGADQLCFRYRDCNIPPLSKSKISSL